MPRSLSVTIHITPYQSEIPIQELDELFAGQIRSFETWFLERQRAHGMEAQGLISAEHAIIRSFMHYIHTTTKAPNAAPDQAQ